MQLAGDHAKMRRLLENGLRRTLKGRVTTETARTVAEAQRFCIKKQLPDLVILDYKFPKQRQQGDRFIEFLAWFKPR